MALNSKKVEIGLLAHNFFPRVGKRGDEFPPCFVSTGFTPAIASKLISLPIPRVDGYGAIAARSTRYDLAPRNMEISHPRAFAAIARHLKTSWDDWKFVTSNPSSAIRVGEHIDGRVFSMVTSADSESLVRPGGRFRAKVDITNFYGSIYTHSFPWALHGVRAAKAKRDDKNDWTNQLDFKLRQARRKETTGISIGPGTSGIAGEILLGQVDNALRAQGFEFLRYIDDYFFVGATRDRAELFVRAVRDELAQLKLSIHPGKTTISELPIAVSPRWMRALRASLRGKSTSTRLIDTLDEAIEYADTDPEDGVLRYALVSLEESLSGEDVDDKVREAVIDRLLNIGHLRPITVGTACRILASLGSEAVKARADALDLLLQEHVSTRRTDAATWILYTLLAHGLSVSEISADTVVKSGDCLAMALVALDPAGAKKVAKFIMSLESESPPDYRRDEYWLLYYQFALQGKKAKAAPSTLYEEFKPLLDAGVTFIDLEADSPYLPFRGSGKDNGTTPPSGGGGSGRSPYVD